MSGVYTRVTGPLPLLQGFSINDCLTTGLPRLLITDKHPASATARGITLGVR